MVVNSTVSKVLTETGRLQFTCLLINKGFNTCNLQRNVLAQLPQVTVNNNNPYLSHLRY